MIFFEPIYCITYQKTLYLCSSVVKIYRTPAAIFTKLFVVTFIQIRSVEFPQALIILTEMTWYPIHYYSYSRFMRRFYQVPKIIRRSITTCRRVITCCLIAPTAVKRMFCQRHKFYMRIVHFCRIAHQLFRQLPVAVIHFLLVAVSSAFTLPTSCVYLIYQHWLCVRRFLILHIFDVLPFVPFQIENLTPLFFCDILLKKRSDFL